MGPLTKKNNVGGRPQVNLRTPFNEVERGTIGEKP